MKSKILERVEFVILDIGVFFRWLGWRLEFVGNLIVFVVVIFVVVIFNFSGGLVGFLVLYFL